MCYIVKKKEKGATQKGKKKVDKREPLRERRQPRKRDVHGEENIKERAKYCCL